MGRLPCVVSKAATLLGVGVFVSDFDIWVCVFWIGCPKTQVFPTILHKCWTLQKDLGTPGILRHSHFSFLYKCHSGSIPEEAMMAPAGLKQPRMPGPPLAHVEGVFWFLWLLKHFFIIFLPCFWFFVPWKFPGVGWQLTEWWRLPFEHFVRGNSAILSHFEPSPDTWGLAMSHPTYLAGFC